MSESHNSVSIQPVKPGVYWLYAIVLFIVLVPLGIGLTIIKNHRQISAQGDIDMETLSVFTENITLYHLWLEKYLTEPTKQNQQLFNTSLQQAKKVISHLQTLTQPSSKRLLHEITQKSSLNKGFEHLIAIGQQRVASRILPATDLHQDDIFDHQFNRLLEQTRAIRKQIGIRLHTDADRLFEDAQHMLWIEVITILLTWTILALIARRKNALAKTMLAKEIQYRTVQEEEQGMKDLILKQKERLKLHFEQTPMGVIEWTPEFEVLRWNPAAEKIFGYTSEEASGHSAFGFILNDEQADAVKELLKNLVDQTSGYHSINYNITKDGSRILCEWYNTPLINHAGNTVGVSSLVIDITDKARMAEAHQRFATMLENTSDLVAIMNPQSFLVYINAAGRNLLGLSPDEPLEKLQLADFYPDSEVEHLRNELFLRAADGPVQDTLICLNRHNEEIPMSCVIMLEKNDDGSVRNYMMTARDLREEQQAQAKLEHAQRLESLGVLAGGIAHDFNNILTGILGNASLANNKLDAASPMKRYLQNIEDGSQRAAELCKQMLAYSGKGKFIIDILNINKIVNDIIRLLEVSIRKNVVIKYHLGDNLPMINADAAQMQQIIMNLVINASESIEGKSGVVSISTGVMSIDANYLLTTTSDIEVATEGRYVYLEVSDTGCGMDKETQKKIFEPFFTTKFTGRGLGMSAILGIVRGHKGAIKCYSEKGKGSSFKVLFPCTAKQLPDRTETMDTSLAVDTPLQGTILIVDDEQTIREMAAMILEELGLTTLLAINGQDGVKMFRENHKNILAVLLDMTMPKMDGVEAFREMRRIDPEIKVILSSGYNEQEAINRFAGKGLAGFIQKPYLPKALQKIILDLIEVKNV